MNHNANKRELTQKLDELLSSIEQLLNNDQNKDFYIERSKQKLIQLYDSICSYNNVSEIHQSQQAQSTIHIQEDIPADETMQVSEPEIIHQEPTQSVEDKTERIDTDSHHIKNLEKPMEVSIDEIVEEPLQEIQHEEPHVQVEEPLQETQHEELQVQTEIIAEEIIAEPTKQETFEEKNQSTENQPQILSDRFKKENTSVFERFNTTKEDKSIGSQLQSTPLHDLKKSIGINDRFSFINELFSGNKEKYDTFIDAIINTQSSNDVITTLNNNAEELQWQKKPSFVKFSEMINRYALSK